LMTEQLDAPLIVVATDSGRTAVALSNRRPTATILALTRTDRVARSLALCWGVTPLVRPDPSSAEHELKRAIDWARSHSLVRSGEYAVLLRGQVAGEPRSRAVLAGEVP
jgi:pyruvate kinase